MDDTCRKSFCYLSEEEKKLTIYIYIYMLLDFKIIYEKVNSK